MPLKISIVTPSFNQGQYLEQTIRSVLDQEYASLEYIVMDGGSNDQSLSIIERYADRLACWTSEKDRGQVHAINKGLARATGDVFAYINSDDVYLPGAFDAVAEYFAEHPECQWLCGDTIMFGPGHKSELIHTRVPASAAHCLSWAYKAPQPGMFWKRSLMENGFDESWRYDFDHDLYVRLLLKGYRCEHLPLPVAAYRWHAISKTMSDRNLFDEEFDRSAEHYEGSLQGSDRRWVRSTRLLRQSYLASGEGRVSEARKLLTQAALTYPEGLTSKLFWGCVRQLSRRKPVAHNDTREGNGPE
ncbi:MAG: hypothetical protein QOE77_2634 [Blastocatellia bacterium]|jgi:glycosyltransferase involved in cell wall biosynthesis|nr:hypothetical protein [Blastocatellia bacterium]